MFWLCVNLVKKLWVRQEVHILAYFYKNYICILHILWCSLVFQTYLFHLQSIESYLKYTRHYLSYPKLIDVSKQCIPCHEGKKLKQLIAIFNIWSLCGLCNFSIDSLRSYTHLELSWYLILVNGYLTNIPLNLFRRIGNYAKIMSTNLCACCNLEIVFFFLILEHI